MNDCENCGNAIYRNGVGGPCKTCVENSNWCSDLRARTAPIERALATQVGGNHYKDMPIQPAEYCHKNGIGKLEGDVIAYVSRWRKKNGIEDLKKARHTLDIIIELESGA